MYRKNSSRDKMTIKVRGMKRSSSRDSPPRRAKRRYEDSDDDRSPSRGRVRERPRSPRMRSPPPIANARYLPSYKVLCVSSLHPKASDDLIKDTLYREYKRYGEISIRMSHDIDNERVAYVCFRSSEDAREAKHTKPRVMIYDKVGIVEPVYERSDVYRRPRSRSLSPEFDRYYRAARSPPPDLYADRYERAYPPIPPPHVPPPLHHDFMRVPIRDPYGVARHASHYPPLTRSFAPRPMRPHYGGGDNYGHESKKDKFPNYLHHVAPEDDPLATRTLFAGNLEIDISEGELRRIFERYGIVEDVDIKRPPPGTGNAFAFVRYQNLDMSHRAKTELSGQYIGKFQCKIGYGKANPTTRVWVGGLGSWTTLALLETEFDRFGAIKKIDYVKGDTSAYILYDSIDAAQAAVKEMRGFALGGADHKLRIDFAEVPGMPPFKSARAGGGSGGSGGPPSSYQGDGESFRSAPAPGTDDFSFEGGYDGFDSNRGRGGRGGYGRPPFKSYDRGQSSEAWNNRRGRSPSPRMRSMDSDSGSEGARNGHLGSARTLSDVARRSIATWQGALVLKNSLFPAKLHMTDGDPDVLDGLMRDEEGKPLLRITQRLRLDQPKLDDVSKRIASAASHAVFLGMPGSSSFPLGAEDANVQTRPLRNLVSYLKQKEAAGVISLVGKDDTSGVLYAFPSCPFAAELLKRAAHGLTDEALREEHLVVVVVRGGVA